MRQPIGQSGKRNANSRLGAALVEFAITVPIVFLLFSAAFDFCRLSMITHTAEQAAYEGARRGSIPKATAALAQQSAEEELERIGLRQAVVTVIPAEIQSTTKEITVQVRIPMNSNGWITATVLKDSYITRSCTLSCEYISSY